MEESYTHSDNLTWTKGAHEVRVGFDVVRHHLNHWQPEIGNFGPRGGLGFNGQETALQRRRGAEPVQRLRGVPAGAFRRCREEPAEHSVHRARMAVRLVRSRPLAGQPEADHQPRPALRVLPADDARRQWHRTAESVHQPGCPGRPRQHAGKRRHQRQQEAVRSARRPGLSLGRQHRHPRRLRHQLRSDPVLAPPARLVSAGDQQRVHGRTASAGPPRSSRAFRIRWVRI